ncbi:MAG: hypothetical protein U9Q80_07880, partial [Bacillota bacterium]|nr:hypothetical protein [Bacillota bacterium]
MNSMRYSKTKKSFLAKLLVVLMVLSFAIPSIPVYAGVNDVTAEGYGINAKYQGGWTTGNLGKTYEEGEWVAFQTEVRNLDWTVLDRIGVEFDFYGTGGRFYDLVRNISVGSVKLTDEQGFPNLDGSPALLGTIENVNAAQRNPYEYYFTGFSPIVLTETEYKAQINKALDESNGTETDMTRIFYITEDQILAADPSLATSDTLVVYFQLHLSRTFIWNNVVEFPVGTLPLAYVYTNYPTDKWGGYVYDESFLFTPMPGAYIFPGSSGHSYVFLNNVMDSGKKTIPIPNVEETTGVISGYKYLDVDGNGEYEEGLDTPLPDWMIYLRTDLYEIPDIEFPTTTDINGYYEFTDLPYDFIWELSEGLEDGYVQTYPHAGVLPVGDYTGNVETEWYKEAETLSNMGGYTGRFDYGWLVKLAPPDHLIQTHVDFMNMFADPRVVITKTGETLSKIGDEVTYIFTVTNIGNVDITLVDILDDKFGILDAYGVAGGFGDILPVGGTQSFDRTFIVPGNADDPFINEVTANYVYGAISATDAEGLVPIDTWETNLFQPEVTIVKTGDELSKIGDDIHYVITVTNTGLADAPPISGRVDDSIVGSVGTFAGLAVGNYVTFEYDYTVQPGDPDPLRNEAVVTASPDGFPNIFTDAESWETNLFQPSITIIKTGDRLSKIGDIVNYVITVTNTSSGDSPNLIGTVDDSLLGVVDANLNLAPGEEMVYNLPYTVESGDLDPLENIVTVTTSPEGFPNVIEATDSWITEIFQPGVMIVKTGDELSKVGDDIHYEITVTNTGSSDSPAISGTVDDSDIGFSGAFSGLAYGQSISFYPVYTVKSGDNDPFTNTAYVTASPDGFPNILEDASSWTTELFQPGIMIDKTGDLKGKVGDPVSYTITVTNTSSDDTPDMVARITDAMLGIDETVTLGF